jgi:ribosomal protein L37AE/L43A
MKKDDHICPICKRKQVKSMETWLCVKCDFNVLYEQVWERQDIEKIRSFHKKQEK